MMTAVVRHGSFSKFRFHGLGLRGQGLGFRVQGLGCTLGILGICKDYKGSLGVPGKDYLESILRHAHMH